MNNNDDYLTMMPVKLPFQGCRACPNFNPLIQGYCMENEVAEVKIYAQKIVCRHAEFCKANRV